MSCDQCARSLADAKQATGPFDFPFETRQGISPFLSIDHLPPSEPQVSAIGISSVVSKGKQHARPGKFRSVTAPAALRGVEDGALSTPLHRISHMAAEQRYRKNLSACIHQLQGLLVSIESSTESKGASQPTANAAGARMDLPSEGQPSCSQAKATKSSVLLSAIDYIQRSEYEKRELSRDNEFLKQRVVALEKLVKCEGCVLLRQTNMLNLEPFTTPLMDHTTCPPIL